MNYTQKIHGMLVYPLGKNINNSSSQRVVAF